MREETPWGIPREGAAPPHGEPLLRVASGQFAFGAVDSKGQFTWISSWDGQTAGVPRLVKFECNLSVAHGQPPLALSRVVRNPSGTLPKADTP